MLFVDFRREPALGDASELERSEKGGAVKKMKGARGVTRVPFLLQKNGGIFFAKTVVGCWQ